MGWLGRQDSNLGMAVPKTAALPLGDAPALRCAEHSHKNAGPQARAFATDGIAKTTWLTAWKIHLTRRSV